MSSICETKGITGNLLNMGARERGNMTISGLSTLNCKGIINHVMELKKKKPTGLKKALGALRQLRIMSEFRELKRLKKRKRLELRSLN